MFRNTRLIMGSKYCLSRPYHFKFCKGCLSRCPFLNASSHIMLWSFYNDFSQQDYYSFCHKTSESVITHIPLPRFMLSRFQEFPYMEKGCRFVICVAINIFYVPFKTNISSSSIVSVDLIVFLIKLTFFPWFLLFGKKHNLKFWWVCFYYIIFEHFYGCISLHF